MEKPKQQIPLAKKVILALAVYISRFGFLPANFSTLGSFGFFGQNFSLFFLTIILFDYFKGGFYSGFWFTYLGFFSYFVFGKLAKTTRKKVFLLPLASFTFFLVSNFGVWYYWYPHTVSGLLTCYALAVPFYKNTLIGDLLFGYGYMVVKYFGEGLKTVKQQKLEFTTGSVES